MPPAATFLTGEQVSIRAELGLLTEPEADERAAARAEVDGWLAMLAREGLLGVPAGGAAVTPEEFTVALYGFLARTPAMLIGVSLAEAAGERRPQNLPGTVNEYPNWRIPLADGAGTPVLLEDLRAHEGVRGVAEAVRGGSRGGPAGGADRVHA
jgi:4-alpha-glucanotransferase